MTRFTVESLQGRQIRPELARAVIESGWNLNELRSVGLSLEEIFLQLTAEHKPEEAPALETPAAVEARPSSREASAEPRRSANEHTHHLPQRAEHAISARRSPTASCFSSP